MQPYTPHGDSNPDRRTMRSRWSMQPYTPHGDSNSYDSARQWADDQMQPYTPHGDSNWSGRRRSAATGGRCNLIPLTGTVTHPSKFPIAHRKMQPYTPHGDSNIALVLHLGPAVGCNLIPLTGTVTSCFPAWITCESDATLYPSRGQ